MREKQKLILTVTYFLIENLTILLTIGVAGFVIYRRQILKSSFSTDDLITTVLAVLALLATSEIVERYRRLNNIEKNTNRTLSLLESRLDDRPSALSFFQKMPALDTHIQKAGDIDMCGVTLTSTINRHFSEIRERLIEGATIRVLLVDPNSQALQMSGARSESGDPEYYRHKLQATFNDLTYFHKKLIEHRNLNKSDSHKTGTLSVRLLSFSPSFSVIGFDAKRQSGNVFVEIYPHKAGIKSPTFELIYERDGEWYEFFVNQFEMMWREAKDWNPEESLIKNLKNLDNKRKASVQ